VADKSQQLVLTALSQAVAFAEGLPLFGSKTSPGLFPATAAGKQAAQRCLDDGYLRNQAPGYSTEPPVGTTGRKSRAVPECFALTDQGFTFLFQQVSPRQVLEDLVRVLEQRQTEITELTRCVRQMQQNLDALKTSTEKVLQNCTPADGSATGALAVLFRAFRQEQAAAPQSARAQANRPAPLPTPATQPDNTAEQAIRTLLGRWQVTSGASEDCPLPELFRQVQARIPQLTLGQFHDVLRRFHDEGVVYLHPWTGPLYDLPEPPQALLVGHEVAYYASLRTEAAVKGFTPQTSVPS